MAPGRIAISATGLVAIGGLVFGLFEVQGWTVPDLLAVILVIVLLIAGIVLLGVLVYETWRLFTGVVLKRWGVQWLIYRKGQADPDQWLLDIAHYQAENPESCLVVTRQVLHNWDVDKDTLRPWIEVVMTLRNTSVHTLLIGPYKGHGHYQGQELPEPIESEGTSRVPAGGSYDLRLKQVVPRNIVTALYSERVDHGRVSLGVGGVTVVIRAECANGHEKKWRIQVPDSFFRAED